MAIINQIKQNHNNIKMSGNFPDIIILNKCE